MYRCKLALCAESVLRDGETNNVSAINIAEQVNASVYPTALVKFAALFTLFKDIADSQTTPGAIRITLNQAEIAKFPINVDFQGKDRTRVIVNLQGLVASAPGVLRTALLINGIEVGGYDTEFSSSGKPVLTSVPNPPPAHSPSPRAARKAAGRSSRRRS